jgi:dihydrofolate synthase/folylpolyglutamate synthase
VPLPETSDYRAIEEYLFALKPQGEKFGIDRMRLLADALGHPERATPCIHLAGTNGKGSVAAMLEGILRAARWRVGLYTSPHLVHLGERVQVDRRPLEELEIVDYLRQLEPLMDRLAATHPGDRPSFFELMTAMAFLQFARKGCDIAVIETGLGGRLDATNVVAPEVCVITSIGLDHCEYLGNEVPQIAAEKAGIIKAGVPVVIGRMPREAEQVIRDVARRVGAPVTSVGQSFPSADTLPHTSLEGEYQRWNAATATLAARALGARWRITRTAIEQGLAHVEWPGRWQRLPLGGQTVVLDASHNPEGAQVLDANLAELVAETGRAPIVITGILGKARAKPLIEAICRHARELYLVTPKDPRACSFEALEALVPTEFSGRVVRTTVESLFPDSTRCAIGGRGDTVVVTGSIYLVGEVMTRLEG